MNAAPAKKFTEQEVETTLRLVEEERTFQPDPATLQAELLESYYEKQEAFTSFLKIIGVILVSGGCLFLML